MKREVLISKRDRAVYWLLRRRSFAKALEKEREIQRRNKATITPAQLNDFSDSIDAKCSALLTHISIMIALLVAIIAINPQPSFATWKKVLIVVEIVFYLTVAVGCLRCVKISGLPHSKQSAELIFQLALYKRNLYSKCNSLVTILTLVLIGTLPLIFFEVPVPNLLLILFDLLCGVQNR